MVIENKGVLVNITNSTTGKVKSGLCAWGVGVKLSGVKIELDKIIIGINVLNVNPEVEVYKLQIEVRLGQVR